MYYLISVFLGLLPEVLYFTLFLSFTKNLKEKRIKLFLLIALSYTLCIFISQYKILFYIIFMFMCYISLKILYKSKTQIIDVFIISVSSIYLTFATFIASLFIKEDLSNYILCYILSRILIFIIFIFKNKFNILYNKYKSLWNRNDAEKRPIKSITLRNISLILLNSFIFLLNIAIINILDFIK